jgi:Family of unknown function (DUF5317)
MLYVTGLALLAGVGIGLASGGRFRFLAERGLRAPWLVVLGFGLQYATDHLKVGRLGTALVLGGAVSLLAFAALNPTLIGIGVVALGVAANALVIGANDGMPVRPGAVVAAHIATLAEEPLLDYGSRHHREGPGDRLRPLGDIIPIPLFREVVSFGDLILAFGVTATLAHLLRPAPRHAVSGGGPSGHHRTMDPTFGQSTTLAPQFDSGPRPPDRTVEPTFGPSTTLAPQFDTSPRPPDRTGEPTFGPSTTLAPQFDIGPEHRAAGHRDPDPGPHPDPEREP